uniref:single-stranded DNA-binding protein n=1 Tax=Escherichia coli TaxID=562 RepID=UPI0011624C9F|nr:Helix-destabilizing protein [Escherichia coli]
MSARGINKVIRRLVVWVNDPEVRYIPNGGAVANLQVAYVRKPGATNRRGRCGSRRNGTAWCCSASSRKWHGEYLRKGAQVYIEGQASVPVAGKDNGITRYVT